MDPPHPAGADRGWNSHPDLREGGIRQPWRLGQGSDWSRDHRGRGAEGRAETRRDYRGGNVRQYRRRAGDRGSTQGLPLHLHNAGQDVAGKGTAAEGLRRRGGHHPDSRPARPPGQLRNEGQADRRRDSRGDPGQPVLQPGESRGPLPDHRPSVWAQISGPRPRDGLPTSLQRRGRAAR